MAQGYAGIPPGPLAAYLGVRNLNEQRGFEDVQAMGQMQKLAAGMDAQKRMEQFRSELASARTPDEQIAVATKYGAPQDVLQYLTQERTRKDALLSQQTAAREAAKVRGEQAIDLERQRAADRENLARVMGGLRPAPQPQPPVAVMRGGKPVYVTREESFGMEPVPPASAQGRNIPSPVLQAMSTNQGNIRRAETALKLLQGEDVTMKGPDGKDIILKGDKNATGMQNYLPDPLAQRMDKPGVDTRAYISDLGSMVIHDRSGAAVTAAEFPRLRPFIPSATDDPEVARRKLVRFVAEYTAIQSELKGMFSEDQGYKLPGRGTVLKFDAQGNLVQ